MTVKSKGPLGPSDGKPMDEATRASSSRDQIDAALKDLAAGKPTVWWVAKKSRADRIRRSEFLKTLLRAGDGRAIEYPVGEPPGSRQVRSDLLTMARERRGRRQPRPELRPGMN